MFGSRDVLITKMGETKFCVIILNYALLDINVYQFAKFDISNAVFSLCIKS